MATISPHPPAASPSAPAAGPELHADGRALSQALSELVRVIQFRDRDRACCHDISVSQCYALKAVAEEGPLTVNELAATLYLDKSTASRVAGGLVEMGLVERGRDPEDGRVVRLRATEEGRRLHGTIEDELAAEYQALLADFEPEVREGLVALVGRLTRSFAGRVQAEGGSCCVLPRTQQ